MTINVAGMIADKRDGKIIGADRIEQLIAAYARDDVPDYQMAAFAMAVYFQGMDFDETVALTRAMLHSGQVMSWSNDRVRVDKHSTGGVGDKISIPLAHPVGLCRSRSAHDFRPGAGCHRRHAGQIGVNFRFSMRVVDG